jgi:hypothetical protein
LHSLRAGGSFASLPRKTYQTASIRASLVQREASLKSLGRKQTLFADCWQKLSAIDANEKYSGK